MHERIQNDTSKCLVKLTDNEFRIYKRVSVDILYLFEQQHVLIVQQKTHVSIKIIHKRHPNQSCTIDDCRFGYAVLPRWGLMRMSKDGKSKYRWFWDFIVSRRNRMDPKAFDIKDICAEIALRRVCWIHARSLKIHKRMSSKIWLRFFSGDAETETHMSGLRWQEEQKTLWPTLGLFPSFSGSGELICNSYYAFVASFLRNLCT